LRSVETETEPGLGLLALKAENARLRRERNEAREELASTPSVPPPTPRQRRARRTKATLLAGASAGVGVALYPLVALVLQAVARRWPELQTLVDFLLPVLGS
jgi:hypothetical protein